MHASTSGNTLNIIILKSDLLTLINPEIMQIISDKCLTQLSEPGCLEKQTQRLCLSVSETF